MYTCYSCQQSSKATLRCVCRRLYSTHLVCFVHRFCITSRSIPFQRNLAIRCSWYRLRLVCVIQDQCQSLARVVWNNVFCSRNNVTSEPTIEHLDMTYAHENTLQRILCIICYPKNISLLRRSIFLASVNSCLGDLTPLSSGWTFDIASGNVK